ncbi:ABC transporter permease [uncultured Muribaculum sp.]|uniref:cell division protein FtsX n=1 Tax=uncultured Muribaculum sp. TaxID=1918613 RepID=UPI002674FFEB|nr:permease-like cell division protein FtsX [uncultured Muribaculum sp.]
MVKKSHNGISIISAQLTSTVSVMLVLLLLGIIALMGIAANSVKQSIQESMGFNIVLADSIPQSHLNNIKQLCSASPAIASQRYVSSTDALAQWQQQTGDDLMEILEVNPFSSEIEIKVKSQYANTDSIEKISAPIKVMPGVSEITVPTQMVDSINQSLRSLALVLTAVSALLLLISFVLINNTVHLAIYARRFTIHTMKLVGATAGFIRKPFITSNILCGIIAALAADAILAAIVAYAHTISTEISRAVSWVHATWVFVVILIAGIIITGTAAFFSTNKYLRSDYNDMFR